jgi:hypothetical protein
MLCCTCACSTGLRGVLGPGPGQGLNYDMYWHFVRLFQVRLPLVASELPVFPKCVEPLRSRMACCIVVAVSVGRAIYSSALRRRQEDNMYKNADNVFGDESSLYILAVPHVDGSRIEGLEPVVVPPA